MKRSSRGSPQVLHLRLDVTPSTVAAIETPQGALSFPLDRICLLAHAMMEWCAACMRRVRARTKRAAVFAWRHWSPWLLVVLHVPMVSAPAVGAWSSVDAAGFGAAIVPCGLCGCSVLVATLLGSPSRLRWWRASCLQLVGRLWVSWPIDSAATNAVRQQLGVALCTRVYHVICVHKCLF